MQRELEFLLKEIGAKNADPELLDDMAAAQKSEDSPKKVTQQPL
jgi:hypothetical protein